MIEKMKIMHAPLLLDLLVSRIGANSGAVIVFGVH